jgi:hypothetical protein
MQSQACAGWPDGDSQCSVSFLSAFEFRLDYLGKFLAEACDEASPYKKTETGKQLLKPLSSKQLCNSFQDDFRNLDQATHHRRRAFVR